MSELFTLSVLILSIIIHEYSHGWMADQLGDPTARYMGRLTLNPLAHVDWVGSVLVPLSLLMVRAVTPGTPIVGWAKPVPYNPYNLRDQKRGPLWVALAGPGANLLMALIFGLFAKVLYGQDPVAWASTIELVDLIVLYNVLLAVFNLVPLPPLDGSKLLEYLAPRQLKGLMDTLEKNQFLFLIIFILWGIDLIMPVVALLYFAFTGPAQLLI